MVQIALSMLMTFSKAQFADFAGIIIITIFQFYLLRCLPKEIWFDKLMDALEYHNTICNQESYENLLVIREGYMKATGNYVKITRAQKSQSEDNIYEI